MSGTEYSDWEALARSHRIDPAEVRLVYERYAAHLRFATAGAADPIALRRWFRFYHMEKSSEGEQTGPAPSACSVDSDAVNNACIRRPREFLEVLQAYAAGRGETA